MKANSISIADGLRAVAPLGIVALMAAVLLRFPPEQYSLFYPECPIYRFLHIECPGCGTTRALAAILHGHISEAFRLNALTTLIMPVGVIYGALCYLRFLRGRVVGLPQPPAAVVYTALAITVVFMVARNLRCI